MFPAKEAADIAVETVRSYLDEQEQRYSEIGSMIGEASGSDSSEERSLYKGVQRVIFNVFSDRDLAIYEEILE